MNFVKFFRKPITQNNSLGDSERGKNTAASEGECKQYILVQIQQYKLQNNVWNPNSVKYQIPEQRQVSCVILVSLLLTSGVAIGTLNK